MADWSSQDVLTEIGRQAGSFGVDPKMAGALFMAENSASGDAKSGSGDAVSTKGAQGILQVMPATARGLQKAGYLPTEWKFDPNDLSSQVQAGLAAIKERLTRTRDPSDVFDLASGYNGGNAAQRNYQQGNLSQLPLETKNYLQKVKVAATNLGMKVPDLNIPGSDSTVGPPAPDDSYQPVAGSTVTPPPVGSTVPAQSTRTTVRRNVNDPGAMADYTSALTTANNSYDSAAAQVVQGGQIRGLMLQQLQQSISDAANAAGQEAATDAAMLAKNAARRAGILSTMNINPDDADNIMIRVSKTIDDTDAAMRAMKPEIDERMSVGMFDNPFQWLVNQTILPGMVAKYNGYASTQNAAIDLYKAKEDIASRAENVSDRMDADLAIQKGLNIQAGIAAKATGDLARAQDTASAATTRDAMQLALVSNEKLGAAAGNVRLTQEKQAETEANTVKLTKEQQDQQALAGVNKVMKTIGGNPYATWREFAAEPKAKQEEILAASRSNKYGDTFGKSFSLVADHGSWSQIAIDGGSAIQGWARGTLTLANKQADISLAAIRAANPAAVTKELKEQTVRNKLDDIQQHYQVQAATDMRNADDSNPFKLQYMPLARSKELANNPVAIFLKTYGPGGTDPRFAKVDEGYLMDRFATSVGRGTMPMADATKAISEFYKTGTSMQQQVNKPQMFGMATPEMTYAVSLTDRTGIKQPVDLGNPTQVEAALTRLVAQRAMSQQMPYDILGAGVQGAQ